MVNPVETFTSLCDGLWMVPYLVAQSQMAKVYIATAWVQGVLTI